MASPPRSLVDALRLLQTSLVERAALERTADRSLFLSEASQCLSESRDYMTTMPQIAKLAIPRVADWCTIVVLDENDTFRRVAVVHRDVSRAPIARAYLEGFPPDKHRQNSLMSVFEANRSILSDDVTDEDLVKASQSEDHLAILRGLGVRSTIMLPIVARGAPVGVISLAMSDDTRRFEPADVTLAEDLARRCALAIDNARLLRDVERRHAAEQSARAQAETANRAKDDFLAMLSHELRNPLSPVVTALELMKLKATDDSKREREVIERQVKHLSRLVDDLLDASRITRGKLELRLASIDLGKVVRRAVEMASPLLEQRRHHLSVELSDDVLPVNGDAVRLQQVVANLLANAARYTEPGGRISVFAGHEGDELVVRVRDNGQGIDSATLPQIFELFVQGPRAPDRAEGGLGLGLALSRNLVEQHGGTLSAHSEGPGRGSELVVRLPRLSDDESKRAEDLVSTPVSGNHSVVTGAGRRVLVVDDNVDSAELVAEFLRSVGHVVYIAFDAPSALELAQRERPEVAVLDIGLPVMDGYELAETLRSLLGKDAPRMIALTGYGQENDRARSAAAGFSSHMVKPIDVRSLLKIVDAAK